MLYLATPSGPLVRDAMTAGLLGCMTSPAQRIRPPAGAQWAADNGVFGKGYPGDGAWWAWLQAWVGSNDAGRCLFATAPDVVGDAAETLERSRPWLPLVQDLGVPAAFVAQNRAEDVGVPWDEFATLFVGGSWDCATHGFVADPVKRGRRRYCPACSAQLVDWKLTPWARDLVLEGRARGKRVHMGRVNSWERWQVADAWGCDSVDGTYLAYGPDQLLPHVLGWSAQGALW